MKKEKVMLIACAVLFSAAHLSYAMENNETQPSGKETIAVSNDNTQQDPEQSGSMATRFVNKATSILSLRSAREFVVHKKWYIAIIAGLVGTLYTMKKTCPWFNRLLACEQEEDDNAQLDTRLINPHRSF